MRYSVQRMPLTPERLAEIDAELDGFGRSDEELAAVVRRANELAASLGEEDGALSELLDGVAEAMAAARAAALADLPARPAPRSVQTTAVGTATPERPEVGSGINTPGEGDPSALPPLDPFPEEVTKLTSSHDLEAAFAEAATSDIQGMSVDELFQDAAPTVPESDASELSDLFDDDEALRLSDPDLGMQPIEVQTPPSPPRSVPPPVPAAAISPPGVEFASFEDGEEEHTSLEAPMMLDEDDDFELLVDEDVLELEAEEGSEEADEGQGGGLISRILSRKQ